MSKITWSPNDKWRILEYETPDQERIRYADQPRQVRKAIDVATEAHRYQYRKDTETPYITHCWGILSILINCEWHFTDEELAAAVLHDVLEDTIWLLANVPGFGDLAITVKSRDELSLETKAALRHRQFQEIYFQFKEEVAGIVWLLTKPDEEEWRRKIYMVSLKRVAPSVIAIKLADMLHNSTDLPAGLMTKSGIPFDIYFRDKVAEDAPPLIETLRMHGIVWHGIANWFETKIRYLTEIIPVEKKA